MSSRAPGVVLADDGSRLALSLVENHITFTIESGSGRVVGEPKSSMRIKNTSSLCLVLSALLMSAGGGKPG